MLQRKHSRKDVDRILFASKYERQMAPLKAECGSVTVDAQRVRRSGVNYKPRLRFAEIYHVPGALLRIFDQRIRMLQVTTWGYRCPHITTRVWNVLNCADTYDPGLSPSLNCHERDVTGGLA